MSPTPPLLLVVAHGVGPRELAAMGATNGANDGRTIDLPPDPMGLLRRRLDLTDELHDLGVAVDRSSLVLRPAGRTDATIVSRLGERATGPAPVTLLEFTSVLEAAEVGGGAAASAAAMRLGELLAACRERLRRGDAPETWFVGLGSPMPVVTRFDLARAFAERVVPPLANDLRVRVWSDVVTIDAANRRAFDLAAALFTERPFVAHGTLAIGTSSRITFHANDGVAFGARRIAARATNARPTTGVVETPLGRGAPTGDAAFATLLARFWMRAAELHAVESPDATPAPTATVATPPLAAERNALASSKS